MPKKWPILRQGRRRRRRRSSTFVWPPFVFQIRWLSVSINERILSVCLRDHFLVYNWEKLTSSNVNSNPISGGGGGDANRSSASEVKLAEKKCSSLSLFLGWPVRGNKLQRRQGWLHLRKWISSQTSPQAGCCCCCLHRAGSNTSSEWNPLGVFSDSPTLHLVLLILLIFIGEHQKPPSSPSKATRLWWHTIHLASQLRNISGQHLAEPLRQRFSWHPRPKR